MDLNKKRRTRDGMKLGDWDGVERCEAHGVMIDGDNSCPACDAKAAHEAGKAEAPKASKKDKKAAKKDKKAE